MVVAGACWCCSIGKAGETGVAGVMGVATGGGIMGVALPLTSVLVLDDSELSSGGCTGGMLKP